MSYNPLTDSKTRGALQAVTVYMWVHHIILGIPTLGIALIFTIPVHILLRFWVISTGEVLDTNNKILKQLKKESE